MLPAAADLLAAGAAGLLARRAAHAAGGRDADLRHGLPAGPVGAAARHRRGHRRRDPGRPLLADRDRDRHRHPADRRLSLHALRPGHAGRQRERGVGHPRRPARGRAVAREHRAAARSSPAAWACSPRRWPSSTPTTLPLQVVPALGAVLFARFTSFGITCLVGLSIGVAAVAAVLRLDAELVPDRQGRAAAWDQRAADLHHHRHRALRARLEPADARRARRAAPAGGAAARAPRLVRCPAARVVGVVALVVLPYDYRQRADHLVGRR